MGWTVSLSAVKKEGQRLVAITPLSFDFEDERFQIWCSHNDEMKYFIYSAIPDPSPDDPFFLDGGRFYGKLLPFMEDSEAKTLRLTIPAELQEYLEECMGDDSAHFFPARLKDWLTFNYDEPMGSFHNPDTGKEEEVTFRQYIDRYDKGELFKVMDYLKLQGDPADIYILAWWA
ncbi:hypothetical protein [Oligoflexus tunisiensis]|uniref:hypothetical protein n=1 Tax=Oligoflexus tunisiensis TaxID=708132 RepID=UPI00114D0CF4|nr:hypothetical protein [Oligoflexus tunisiensis]